MAVNKCFMTLTPGCTCHRAVSARLQRQPRPRQLPLQRRHPPQRIHQPSVSDATPERAQLYDARPGGAEFRREHRKLRHRRRLPGRVQAGRSQRLDFVLKLFHWRHDIQPSDNQQNDIQPNDIQPNGNQPDGNQQNDTHQNGIQHHFTWLNCDTIFPFMLCVLLLNGIMLNGIMLNVIMMSVIVRIVVPLLWSFYDHFLYLYNLSNMHLIYFLGLILFRLFWK